MFLSPLGWLAGGPCYGSGTVMGTEVFVDVIDLISVKVL